MLIASTILVVVMIYSNPLISRSIYMIMALSLWFCCLFKFMFLSDSNEDKR